MFDEKTQAYTHTQTHLQTFYLLKAIPSVFCRCAFILCELKFGICARMGECVCVQCGGGGTQFRLACIAIEKDRMIAEDEMCSYK